MRRRQKRRAVRRALTAGLAGAALSHGGATAGAQVATPDQTEPPTASPTSTPTSTPTPTPTPEPEPTAQPEPTPTAQPEPTPTAQPEPTPTAQPEPTPTAQPEPPRQSEPTATALPGPTPGATPWAGARAVGERLTDGDAAPTGLRSKRRQSSAPAPTPAPHERDRPAAGQGGKGRAAPLASPLAGTVAAPAPTVVLPGVMPVGVPDFFIDRFRIPPFLLPIYQAAGTEYGVRWEVLAAINEIETDYGRNLNVSSAGAVGWMQFMPATWKAYGVDANGDGFKDPYNPVDAIFAAARYLRAAGADTDLRKAIFAYNHADWYVDSVVLRARVIGGMPSDLVGSLTGLVEGRFPLRAQATYTGRLQRRAGVRGASAAARLQGPAAQSRSIRIFARAGAPAVAVHDARVVATGQSGRFGRFVTLRDAYGNRFTYGHLAAIPGAVRAGARVSGGRVIGRVGAAGHGVASHLSFSVRPAGRGAPWIDPAPVLDGWKLLESTANYRAAGRHVLFGSDGEAPTVGQILLMGKGQLTRRVLADPRLDIYGCGRRDIEAGLIDRRVLATLAFLSASGLRPTVTSLQCGHGVRTASGNISEHSTGTAVDIAAVNGIPILGHQGSGSVTDVTIQRLLTLQGAMKPHQIISLMTFAGAGNTLAMDDHADHIHVGWRPRYGSIKHVDATLAPKQWTKLIHRLSEMENPVVPDAPARSAGRTAGP